MLQVNIQKMNLPEYKRDSLGKDMLAITIVLIISTIIVFIPIANIIGIGPRDIIKTLDEVKKNYGNR